MAEAELIDYVLLRGGHNATVVTLGVMLLGVAAGVVGCFAVLRKRALMADALSHATLPGVCAGFLVFVYVLGYERSVGLLLLGGGVSGVVGVLAVQWLAGATRLGQDAAIGIVLSVFFGVGVVLLSVIQQLPTGGRAGLSHFIYGQAAAMSVSEVRTMAVVAGVSVVTCAALVKVFALVCFDEGAARVGGWPVGVIDLMMMALVVLVTVAGLAAVGLIMVVALLIVPAATARLWTDRLGVMLVLAAVVGGMSGYMGVIVSAAVPDMPAGGVVVLVCGCVFGVSLLVSPRRGVIVRAVGGVRMRVRMAVDHVLREAVEGEQSNGLAGGRRGWALMWLMRMQGLIAGKGESWEGGVTEKGRARGLRVSRNHRLWKRYLVEHADIAASHVDVSADMVEHVLGGEMVRKLERAVARENGRERGQEQGVRRERDGKGGGRV